ncbi:CDP-diacylglycerol--glycerol-3-phosphate 3-phosphatidyltransferase [Savitreella phatthalungensis]
MTFDPLWRPLCLKLDRIAPRFLLPKGSIDVLYQPDQFYVSLKQSIRRAERRIWLSTLYIGKEETELVGALRSSLRAKPRLKLSVTTDALRGTREAPAACCASLLSSLVSEFGADRVELNMFHSPALHGWRKRIVPRRFDEGWGLQHMKIYGIDDEVMLSGANLSAEYFSNRQDRYHVFRNAALADYYHGLHATVASLSYKVKPNPQSDAGFELYWADQRVPEPVRQPRAFREHAQGLFEIYTRPGALHACDFSADEPACTVVYPLVQMSPLAPGSCRTEQAALNAVLDHLADKEMSGSRWLYTAGYFNVFPEYREHLLRTRGTGNVITASPDANGFYKSSGPSGMLVAAYTLLAKRFIHDVERAGKSKNISISEWQRGSFGEVNRWTYHAKGIWIAPRNSALPSLTLIGSSNMTRRSQKLDLEATALLITADNELQRKLADEWSNLEKCSKRVTAQDLSVAERRADLKTRIALWICQGML